MDIISNIADLRRAVHVWQMAKHKIAFVPTMGALHKGHLSLIKAAKSHGEKIIVSIFVNPLQFSPNEDFGRYPRTLGEDIKLLEEIKVDALYTPKAQNMYHENFSARVTLGAISNELEGAVRKGFFDGVATVVLKFLMQINPDFVVFGEKDYQQLCLMQKMLRELDINIEVIAVPTVREADGLALSSRNRYLNIYERKIAPQLYFLLNELAIKLRNMESPQNAMQATKHQLLQAGFQTVDYVEVRHAETLLEPKLFLEPTRILAAATLGKTRLIDNIAL
jgi:pantoate--beta-alanine ligase